MNMNRLFLTILLSTGFAYITTNGTGQQASTGKPIYLSSLVRSNTSADNTFKNTITSGNVVVDFYADWCVPCKQMDTVLQTIARDFTQITFLKVNIDSFNSSSKTVRMLVQFHPILSVMCVNNYSILIF